MVHQVCEQGYAPPQNITRHNNVKDHGIARSPPPL